MIDLLPLQFSFSHVRARRSSRRREWRHLPRAHPRSNVMQMVMSVGLLTGKRRSAPQAVSCDRHRGHTTSSFVLRGGRRLSGGGRSHPADEHLAYYSHLKEAKRFLKTQSMAEIKINDRLPYLCYEEDCMAHDSRLGSDPTRQASREESSRPE